MLNVEISRKEFRRLTDWERVPALAVDRDRQFETILYGERFEDKDFAQLLKTGVYTQVTADDGEYVWVFVRLRGR